ncbi:MAG: glycosyltransferase family 2 protein [Chitinophagaceae bacterium]|nr:glycosyltransferase family 2 protein [Chitinophagaceae bacterium]
MILSVIIVNYNVKILLGECLASVQKAIGGIEAEVFIVDNASTDNSIEYLQPLFPQFNFIRNEVNTGFAKANNQALKLASGQFILFLNPDTLVEHDCFSLCISFMNAHSDAGALGVRMLNGHNQFLKESKRGFPSPMVSLWKMTGFTGLFPRSPIFAKYYLGHLDENKTNIVDVLSGAFMFVRKSVLDKTGGFDERFFMYAEDIDLSYRITLAGYKNYYYPEVTIIHYKGESTKKDFKYIKQFYLAMSQFVKKYYGKGVYSFLLDSAIWFRAGIHALIKK